MICLIRLTTSNFFKAVVFHKYYIAFEYIVSIATFVEWFDRF